MWRQTQREEGHVNQEVEVEMMQLQAKEHQGLPATTRSWEREWEGSPWEFP